MNGPERDRVGRATFYGIASRRDVRPTERETRWLKHLERHGPQSSQYLFEMTRDTHRCKDAALRDLQKLRAGGYLRLPPQQRTTEHAPFNPYIYDLDRGATDYLQNEDLKELAYRPTGHWWHSYAVACASSSIDIAAARSGARYIPAHQILAIRNAEFAMPLGRTILIPDQIFAIDYGGRFRSFALEVDRGTEPKNSAAKRKSWARSIEQYAQVLEQQAHRAHYGLKSNLLVLWVFMKTSHEGRFLEMVAQQGGPVVKSLLTNSVDERALRRTPVIDLFEGQWSRADGGALSLSIG